jgi:hypothetical protein
MEAPSDNEETLGTGDKPGDAHYRANLWHGEGHIYDEGGLRWIHNHEFLDDPAFRKAYERGVRAAGDDYRWRCRVHIGL